MKIILLSLLKEIAVLIFLNGLNLRCEALVMAATPLICSLCLNKNNCTDTE